MMRTLVALLLLLTSVVSALETVDLDASSIKLAQEKTSQDENSRSQPGILLHVTKVLKENSSNFQKASSDGSSSSSGSFGSSLWGVFLYILIALVIVVAVLIFLVRNIVGPKPTVSKAVSKENLVNAPVNRNNTPQPRFQVPRSPSPSTAYDNQAMRFNNPSPTYPPQQPNTSYQPYSPGLSTFASNQDPSAPASQENYYLSSSFYNGPSPPPAPVTPLPRYDTPPPATPIVGRFSSQSKPAESEYNPDFYSQTSEDPFNYLEKYQPYTSQEQFEVAGQTNMEDMSTKRAVLRDSTPYQVIEERVQGEDYDDSDTFVTFPNALNPTPNPKPQLSSNDSFNDGKNRLVRVLPRFHQNQQGQMVGGSNAFPSSTAVFQPVAPAPPPPPPQSKFY